MTAHSVSGLTEYQECAAKWWFAHRSGIKLEQPPTPDQQRGSVFHAGIAAALTDGRVEGVVAYACGQALNYASENGVPLAIAEQATGLLEYHIPRIGINQIITAFQFEGKPMIEWGFNATFEEVSVRGTLDAVVRHTDGRLLLLDWKLRSNPYDLAPLRMDKQLYVYAAVLRHVYGVTLDGIVQVQIRSKLPDGLKLLKGKTGGAATDYARDIGKTTASMIKARTVGLEDATRRKIYLRFADKIEREMYFLNYAPMPLGHADMVMGVVLEQMEAMNRDTQHLPVLNAYTCKGCGWIDHCHERTFKRGEGTQ